MLHCCLELHNLPTLSNVYQGYKTCKVNNYWWTVHTCTIFALSTNLNKNFNKNEYTKYYDYLSLSKMIDNVYVLLVLFNWSDFNNRFPDAK